MTPFTPSTPNKPRTSKRMTDREFRTKLGGIRKAMAVAGRVEPSEEDMADLRRWFVRWCEDWTPKENK